MATNLCTMQDPQVKDAKVTTAKLAREESELVKSETLSKRSSTPAPVPGSLIPKWLLGSQLGWQQYHTRTRHSQGVVSSAVGKRR